MGQEKISIYLDGFDEIALSEWNCPVFTEDVHLLSQLLVTETRA